jgi:hypothetical protein
MAAIIPQNKLGFLFFSAGQVLLKKGIFWFQGVCVCPGWVLTPTRDKHKRLETRFHL